MCRDALPRARARSLRILRTLAVLAVLVVAPASGEASDGAGPGETIVNCLEEAHALVQKMRADHCRGRIISQAEAEAVEGRRKAYVREALNAVSEVAPGRRLAGVGTGFFVNRRGWLVTNRHVVDDCEVVSVSPTRGKPVEATVVAAQARTDLALLSVAVAPPGTARFTLAAPRAAERLAVVGYPDHGIPPIKPMLTEGDALGVEKTRAGIPVIGIRANVRPGNSGGPAVDETGQVVGVVFAKIDTPSVYQATGRVIRDLGFIIPAEVVLTFLDANGIEYRTAGRSRAPEAESLLEHVRPFVARVGCWK